MQNQLNEYNKQIQRQIDLDEILEAVREEAANRHADVLNAAAAEIERYSFAELKDAVLDMIKLYKAAEIPQASFNNTIGRMRSNISSVVAQFEDETLIIFRLQELDRAVEESFKEFRKGKIIILPKPKIILPNT